MPISRIKTDGIQDEAVTSAKIGDNIDLDGQFVRVPHGTTAERPGSPAAGYLRFNTDQGTLEQWNTNTNSWAAVDSPPVITSVTGGTGLDPAGGETVTVNGSNFKSGAIISVNGTSQTTSFISTTQVTFVTTAQTAGDYDVKLTNPNGLSATSTNAVSFNGLPAFSSPASGAISGDYAGGSPIPTITIVAAEPDGGTISYSITSGSLPPGTSLNGSAGTIDGTPTNTATTNYPFTVTATDDESQTSTRNFTLNVLRPVYNHTISNSLVLDDGNAQYLERLPAGGSTRTWTMSFWIKPNNMTDSELFSCGSLNNRDRLETPGTGTAGRFFNYGHVYNSSTYWGFSTNNSIEPNDQSGWYHLVIKWNVTDGTDSERFKFWVNGIQLDMASSAIAVAGTAGTTYPPQNLDSYFNSNVTHRIGTRSHQLSNYWDGTIADFHFTDGYAYDATDFGGWYNGVWAPKEFTGNYGSQGWHLDFADYSNPGNDVSGNNADWSNNNFSLGETSTTRSVINDSPTKNYPVFNQRLWRYQAPNLTNGGVRAVASTDHVIGTTMMMPRNSGKYYFEVEIESLSGGSNNYVSLYSDQDNEFNKAFIWLNASSVVGGSSASGSSLSQATLSNLSYTTGDYVMVAVDTDNEKIYYGVNGTWGTGSSSQFDPTNSSGDDILASMGYSYDSVFGADSNFIGYSFVDGNSSSDHRQVINFGQRPFQGTMPSGYKELNSKNLPEPGKIGNALFGNQWQDFYREVTYTGNSSTKAVTGMGFQPDLIIAKADSTGSEWRIFDNVRDDPTTDYNYFGVSTNNTNANLTFDSDGMTFIGGGGNANDNGLNYNAWGFKAENGTSINNDGATPSRVSVNANGGFSIVRWSGAGQATTVGHGLPTTPTFMLIKNLDLGVQWTVYHKVLANDEYLTMHTDGRIAQTGDAWNNQTMTDSVINVGTLQNLGGDSNSVGDEIIAYCWTDVEGLIKTGRYHGNASSTESNFVYTGFQPQFILLKNFTGSANNWMLTTPSMTPYWGANTGLLRPNLNSGFSTGSERIRFFTNGFRPDGAGLPNDNTDSLYFAIGKPFKYNNATTSNGNYLIDG